MAWLVSGDHPSIFPAVIEEGISWMELERWCWCFQPTFWVFLLVVCYLPAAFELNILNPFFITFKTGVISHNRSRIISPHPERRLVLLATQVALHLTPVSKSVSRWVVVWDYRCFGACKFGRWDNISSTYPIAWHQKLSVFHFVVVSVSSWIVSRPKDVKYFVKAHSLMSLGFQMVQKLTFSDGSLAQIFRWLKSSAYKAAHIFRALKILASALALPSPFPPPNTGRCKNATQWEKWPILGVYGYFWGKFSLDRFWCYE